MKQPVDVKELAVWLSRFGRSPKTRRAVPPVSGETSRESIDATVETFDLWREGYRDRTISSEGISGRLALRP